jgi:orotidine-5'-phosphate decarboxylase
MLVNPLLVALDVDTAERARSLAATLRGAVGGFKVGNELFSSAGPAVVESLVGLGDRVFLDLKYHDIPNTVARAVTAATRLGVWMIDVHACGGTAMMRAAVDAARSEAAKLGTPAPLIVAVTVLTSLDQAALAAVGVHGTLIEQVGRLAALAEESGLDGVVASPHEVGVLRRQRRPGFVIVTPGVRGGAAVTAPAGDDQARTASPAAAMAAGATCLVIGRPIFAASDPRAAAERITADLGAARPR